MPDASVLGGGGGAPGPQNNRNFEVYYPPYLYDETGDIRCPAETDFGSRSHRHW